MSERQFRTRPAPGSALCRLDEIDPDLGTLRLVWSEWDGPWRVVLIRRGEALYAYRNQCPHALAQLDHPPGDFLDAERRHLQCSFHGARFRIEDGRCVSGPCKDRGLLPLAIEIEDGIVKLAARPKPSAPPKRAAARKTA